MTNRMRQSGWRRQTERIVVALALWFIVAVASALGRSVDAHWSWRPRP
ncbi:MAG TPA: hypothetical protein VF808_20385 [Ktedonobacterales bacterium]